MVSRFDKVYTFYYLKLTRSVVLILRETLEQLFVTVRCEQFSADMLKLFFFKFY